MTKYVHDLSLLSEDMPPEVVQVRIDTSKSKVEM